MAFDLESITIQEGMSPPRILLLGVEKIGKSTFASQAPEPVFLPIKGEEGIDAIKVKQFPTCNSYDDVLQCLGALAEGDHDYRTVVIDSSSALEPLIWDKTCRENGNVESIEKVGGGYAKGYTEALKYWRQLSGALDWLREKKQISSIIIGHIHIKRFDDPGNESYDQFQWDIHTKAANLMYRWADCILFCNTQVVVRKEDIGFQKEKKRGVDPTGERFLFTQRRPAHPGGGRGVFGRIPYKLPLSWAAFQKAVEEEATPF